MKLHTAGEDAENRQARQMIMRRRSTEQLKRSDALLRYSFFYRGDNDYRNSSVSFCNAEPLLISDFFSAPLAKQKETRYNMTKRTKLVIFKEAWAWLLPTMKQNNFTRRC